MYLMSNKPVVSPVMMQFLGRIMGRYSAYPSFIRHRPSLVMRFLRHTPFWDSFSTAQASTVLPFASRIHPVARDRKANDAGLLNKDVLNAGTHTMNLSAPRIPVSFAFANKQSHYTVDSYKPMVKSGESIQQWQTTPSGVLRNTTVTELSVTANKKDAQQTSGDTTSDSGVSVTKPDTSSEHKVGFSPESQGLIPAATSPSDGYLSSGAAIPPIVSTHIKSFVQQRKSRLLLAPETPVDYGAASIEKEPTTDMLKNVLIQLSPVRTDITITPVKRLPISVDTSLSQLHSVKQVRSDLTMPLQNYSTRVQTPKLKAVGVRSQGESSGGASSGGESSDGESFKHVHARGAQAAVVMKSEAGVVAGEHTIADKKISSNNRFVLLKPVIPGSPQMPLSGKYVRFSKRQIPGVSNMTFPTAMNQTSVLHSDSKSEQSTKSSPLPQGKKRYHTETNKTEKVLTNHPAAPVPVKLRAPLSSVDIVSPVTKIKAPNLIQRKVQRSAALKVPVQPTTVRGKANDTELVGLKAVPNLTTATEVNQPTFLPRDFKGEQSTKSSPLPRGEPRNGTQINKTGKALTNHTAAPVPVKLPAPLSGVDTLSAVTRIKTPNLIPRTMEWPAALKVQVQQSRHDKANDIVATGSKAVSNSKSLVEHKVPSFEQRAAVWPVATKSGNASVIGSTKTIPAADQASLASVTLPGFSRALFAGQHAHGFVSAFMVQRKIMQTGPKNMLRQPAAQSNASTEKHVRTPLTNNRVISNLELSRSVITPATQSAPVQLLGAADWNNTKVTNSGPMTLSAFMDNNRPFDNEISTIVMPPSIVSRLQRIVNPPQLRSSSHSRSSYRGMPLSREFRKTDTNGVLQDSVVSRINTITPPELIVAPAANLQPQTAHSGTAELSKSMAYSPQAQIQTARAQSTDDTQSQLPEAMLEVKNSETATHTRDSFLSSMSMQMLADRVFRILERRLVVERERRGIRS